jgi:hypothetical protein
MGVLVGGLLVDGRTAAAVIVFRVLRECLSPFLASSIESFGGALTNETLHEAENWRHVHHSQDFLRLP